MHIAFVTGNYPTPSRPAMGTFVRQFVHAMARRGHACTVIHPASLFDRRYGPYPPRCSTESAGDGHAVRVQRPRHLSFSSRDLGWTHTGRWTNALFVRAVSQAMEKLPSPPDLVYGHFMYPAGHAAIQAARRAGVPSVVGVGEGEFWTLAPVGLGRAARQLREATAFLAVSTCIAEELAARLEIPAGKIAVFPNGVDLGVFHPRDRQQMRAKLGLPAQALLVGYVGPFVAQKGYPQLVEAVAGLEDVRLVLLGRGEHPRNDPQTAFCGTVAHAEIAEYLCACDLFVLPTRIEGSCNSVIEAMACGLPIVTANGRYMDDSVDDKVAIRVDPADVSAIRAAILALQNDPARRRRMSAAGVEKSKGFDIDERARRVTAWMETLVVRERKEISR